MWWFKKVNNSHRLPQRVEIPEFNNPEDNPILKDVPKGHKLALSRDIGNSGYHLFASVSTNGRDTQPIKYINISWSEWGERIFNFRFRIPDERVTFDHDQIRIDLGSFNNCESSINFLKRSLGSDFIKIDLLDYIPDDDDFEYEKDIHTQSVFCPCLSRGELSQFIQGLHFTDS